MTKKYIYLIFSLFSLNLFSQQTFRTVHDDVNFHSEVYEKNDGSFIFTGSITALTDFSPFFGNFPFLTNLDNAGEIVETNIYADVTQEPIFFFYQHDLLLISSNHVYLTGSFIKDNGMELSGIIKIDPAGNPIWFTELIDPNVVIGQSYLAVENSQQEILFFSEQYLSLGVSKLNVEGDVIFNKKTRLDILLGIFDVGFNYTDKVQSGNVNTYISGSVSTSSSALFSGITGFVQKVDTNGLTSAVWTIDNFIPHSIEENSAGDLILIGNSLIDDVFFPVIVKMNADNGNIIQSHYIPIALNDQKYAGGQLTSSGEIVVIIQQYIYPYTVIFKLSSDLDVLFSKVYPGALSSFASKIAVAQDEGIIFLTRVKVEGALNSKAVITKLDKWGDFTGLEIKEICLDEPIPFDLGSVNQTFTIEDVSGVSSSANFGKFPYTHTPAELDTIIFPSPYFNLPDNICINQCTSPTGLENEYADSWEWYFEGADTENYTVANPGQVCWSESGTYTVRQIISFQNCLDTFEQVINVYPEIENSLADSISFCPDDLALLVGEAENVDSYLWNTGETTASILVEQEGLYILNSSNEECNRIDSIYVNFGDDNFDNISLIQMSEDSIICHQSFPFLIPLDTSFIIEISGENGNIENQGIVNQAGIFTASAEIDGCVFSETVEIKSKHCDIVYLPNAFSPNNDGINDIFRPEGIYFQSEHLRIYDRWGNLLFSEKGENIEWNGEAKGQRLDTGNFVYVFEYLNLLRNEKELVSGDVLLVR